jgi:tryptophan-specific transport protein
MLAVALTMVVMTVSGWMLLESYQGYPLRVSFDTVTRDLLGEKVNALNNLSVYFVGGILLYAYITSAGLIIDGMTGMGSQWASVLFTLAFSCWCGTHPGGGPHLGAAGDPDGAELCLRHLGPVDERAPRSAARPGGQRSELRPYALVMLPVALTSFGYHHSVSSMRAYYGEERRASRAILGGTLIALAFYLIWLVSVFGNLPRSEFGPVIAEGNVDALLKALGSVIESRRWPAPSTPSPWRPSSPPSSGWGSGCSTTWRICSSSTTAGVAAPSPGR